MFKLLFFLIAILIFSFFYNLDKKDDQQFRQQIYTQTVEINGSEDLKGLGYSSQNKLISNSKSQMFVTYRKKVNQQYSIFVSRLIIENGNLKMEKSVNVSGGKNLPNQRVGSLAVDKEDNLHLVWYGETESKNGGRQIKYAKSKDRGETWSDPVIVSFVEGFNKEDLWQEHPSVAVDVNGKVYVAWEGKDKDHPNQQIKFSKSEDGKIWTGWRNILPGPSSQSRPNILLDSKGNLFVLAYSRNRLRNQQIWMLKSVDEGENWSDWQRVSTSDTDSRHADAVIDSNDKIHIAWRQGTERNKSQIYYSMFGGKEFSAPAEVASSNNIYQFFPQTGLGKSNEIFVTWIETDKKSGYPEDDPETGDSYFTSKNPQDKNFNPKTLIEKNAIYPNVLFTSLIDDTTMVIFSKSERGSFPVAGRMLKLR